VVLFREYTATVKKISINGVCNTSLMVRYKQCLIKECTYVSLSQVHNMTVCYRSVSYCMIPYVTVSFVNL